MRKILLGFLMTFLLITFFISGWYLRDNLPEADPVLGVKSTPAPTPLTAYTIDSLAEHQMAQSEFEVIQTLDEEPEITSYLFEHKFDPDFDITDQEKTTTGVITTPNEDGKYPLVIMFRGYVDQTIYSSGVGTVNGARYFANSDFITLSPDFLGYAGSDIESSDIFESRFQTYTTAISVLNSIDNLNKALRAYDIEAEWDEDNVFIWAHSNGGQIALTALVATKRNIPTTLWAPVTKSFPYSVLYYTDESIDGGKFIRSELAKFEDLYDVDNYAFNNYLDNINAPIQLHQGGADDAVPVEWSNAFVKRLEAKEKDITYYNYPDADHNMRPNWDEVIARDVDFFLSNIEN